MTFQHLDTKLHIVLNSLNILSGGTRPKKYHISFFTLKKSGVPWNGLAWFL